MDAETIGAHRLPLLDTNASVAQDESLTSSASSASSQFTGRRTAPSRAISRPSSIEDAENKSPIFRAFSGVTPGSVSSVSSILRNKDSSGSLQPLHGIDKGSCVNNVAHLTPSSHNEVDHGCTPPPLEDRIRERMITSADSHERFLPICELEEIITLPNIKAELERSGRVKSNMDIIARQVLEPPPDKDTSRRIIFAILCLLEKAPKILAFIQEGYFDCHLPFDFTVPKDKGPTEGFNPPPRLFTSWRHKNIDGFEIYQGQLLAPYFKLRNDNNFNFSRQKLHPLVVLPFVKYEVKDRVLGKTVQGGSSEVRIVKIHHAHHDYVSPGSTEDIYFAVKKLQKIDDTSVLPELERVQEVQAYKRLNYMQHPHLTRLLATFTHRKHLHLIFPYATGDLHNFWYDHYPKPAEPLRGHKFIQWMSRQFVGLAQALHVIHHCDVKKFVAKHSSIDAAKTHGRHGDLKPENILWFKHESSGSEDAAFGVLKISDFGFAEFHSPLSLSVGASEVGGITPTYKAPEFDMNRMSPKYDIWSFGCILLQFVVWYLRGWDGVEEFSKRRMDESNRLPQMDDFFNFYSIGEDILVTEAKPSVRQEITFIRDHAASSDFILDLVDFIESRLLRMTAQKRATCEETKEKLEELEALCRKSIEYCTQKRKPIRKTATDLSDRVEVDVSERMRQEIIETIDPTSPKIPRASTWPEPSLSTRMENATPINTTAAVSNNPETNPHSPTTGLGISVRVPSNDTGIEGPNNPSSSITNEASPITSKSPSTSNKTKQKPDRGNLCWVWLRKLLPW